MQVFELTTGDLRHMSVFGRTPAIKLQSQEALIKHSEVSANDLWYLSVSCPIAMSLRAQEALLKHSDVSASDLSSMAFLGHTPCIKIQAQESLIAHPKVSTNDLRSVSLSAYSAEIRIQAEEALNTPYRQYVLSLT